MPALITHRLFGEKSIDSLPAGLVDSVDERAAFLLGNQGPDPFFFRVRSSQSGACMELARRMHRSRMSSQLEALRDGVAHLHRRDAGVGLAYTLGLLSHYTLDRMAHPFVYAQQWGIQAADPDLAGAGSEVHAVIESDIDVLMLQLLRDGATVEEYPPVGELVTTDRVDMVVGALMSFMANRVYDIEIGANEFGGAVADMQLAYRAIEPAGSTRTSAIAKIEQIFKDYSLLQSLAHRVTTEPPVAAGNLEHDEWVNPFTDEPSCESFPELFERALDDYEQVAARFVATGDAAAITRHINYSGRPLGQDEEFDVEE